jgi:hypothetical protein
MSEGLKEKALSRSLGSLRPTADQIRPVALDIGQTDVSVDVGQTDRVLARAKQYTIPERVNSADTRRAMDLSKERCKIHKQWTGNSSVSPSNPKASR